jgi:hypothetical protein
MSTIDDIRGLKVKKKKCESRHFFLHSLYSMDVIFKPQYYFFKFISRYLMNRRVVDTRLLEKEETKSVNLQRIINNSSTVSVVA